MDLRNHALSKGSKNYKTYKNMLKILWSKRSKLIIGPYTCTTIYS